MTTVNKDYQRDRATAAWVSFGQM